MCPNPVHAKYVTWKSSNGWTLMVLYSFSGWTQIVQVPVFKQIKQISQIYQNSFGKPKLCMRV